MINKIYEYIKDLIRENYKSLLLFVGLYIVLMFPVDFYITTGGGTIDMEKRVAIKDSTPINGSMNLAYVSEVKGTISTYLLSFLIPKWNRTPGSDYRVDDSDNEESILFRNKLELNESIGSAIKVAYSKANKSFTVTDEQLFIVYSDKSKNKSLHVGDEILLIDNQIVKDFDSLKNLISSKNIGDFVTFKVKRNNEELEVKAKVFLEDNNKIVGISVSKSYKYKTNPKIELFFKESESGPSGGLMLSLNIYDRLVNKDLIRGKKIVGTGTISETGSVGEIGGVTYKLMGAVKAKADIFIVPSGDNYKDAVALKKENGYNIEIIGVKNFDEAVKSLENIK